MEKEQKNADEAVIQEAVRDGGKGHEIAAVGTESKQERISLDSKSEDLIELRLSRSLVKKLKNKALLEGVSYEDLASELIAEGLVLRAWEIMERKSAMRQSGNGNNAGHQSNNSNSRHPNKQGGRHSAQQGHGRGARGGNSSANNFQNSGHNKGQGNRRGQNHQNILEDSANFLEYVRAQEKRNAKS